MIVRALLIGGVAMLAAFGIAALLYSAACAACALLDERDRERWKRDRELQRALRRYAR